MTNPSLSAGQNRGLPFPRYGREGKRAREVSFSKNPA
jgi:hypothetical protein